LNMQKTMLGFGNSPTKKCPVKQHRNAEPPAQPDAGRHALLAETLGGACSLERSPICPAQ
jgi:hypothetical protein